jgi:hypothetical protein
VPDGTIALVGRERENRANETAGRCTKWDESILAGRRSLASF